MKQSKNKLLQIFSISILLILSAILIFNSIYRIKQIKEYKSLIISCTEKFGLDSTLVLAVVRVESNFNKNAKSNKNAYGLMQIKKDTFDYVCAIYGFSYNKNQILVPEINILVGCAYLRYLIDKFDGELEALAAYNAGEGNVKAWLKDENLSKDGKTLDKIPFKETKSYVDKVINYQKLYRGIINESSCTACYANNFIL